MRSRSFLGLNARGFHRLHYTERGAANAPVVVCVHGLTQTGRSFDRLAEALAPARRVVCLDVAGRGRSDWLPDPAGYTFPQYIADVGALISRLDVETIDFVGTSMGGIIGMVMASMGNSPIRRLVINDVGPFIPKAALERIRKYVGGDPRFPDVDALEAALRVAWAPFGPLDDAQWRHLAETSSRVCEDGTVALAYDPAIAQAFADDAAADVDLWSHWDAVACPTLVVRGGESDLLLAETAAEMTRRGPKARIHEMPGIGHAPTLMFEHEIAPIVEFLTD